MCEVRTLSGTRAVPSQMRWLEKWHRWEDGGRVAGGVFGAAGKNVFPPTGEYSKFMNYQRYSWINWFIHEFIADRRWTSYTWFPPLPLSCRKTLHLRPDFLLPKTNITRKWHFSVAYFGPLVNLAKVSTLRFDGEIGDQSPIIVRLRLKCCRSEVGMAHEDLAQVVDTVVYDGQINMSNA